MIYSFDLEKKVLAGLIQHQSLWHEMTVILKPEDFFHEDSKLHVTLFKMIRNALNNREAIDDTILIDRIKNLGVTFPDSVDVPEYIRSLAFFAVPIDTFRTAVKELKKYTFRRSGIGIAHSIENYVQKIDPSKPYSELVEGLDRIYNDAVKGFEMGDARLVNIATVAEEIVEDRGDNPPEEVGLMSPYPTINKIYGSIVRPGNCSVIAARSKVGKTSFAIDFLLKVAYKYKVPILHFDNGEMSVEELVFRMVSGASGIPVHLLESGKWRNHGYKDWSAKEVVERVRSVWKKMDGLKILYENVAGLSSEEMVSLLERIYYSEVGRGNQMIFSFDYLKSDFNNAGKGNDWLMVGKTLHLFKQCISRRLVFDGKQVVGMVTSIQTNRLGITTNKSSDAVVEDESVISLSDNIIQFASHLFLLRKKTLDELVDEGERFGTHKLICLAARHLGEDAMAHINPIELEDGSFKNNFINLRFENFDVQDCGDLREIVKMKLGDDVEVEESGDSSDEIPFELQ